MLSVRRIPSSQISGDQSHGGRFHETIVFPFIREKRFYFPAQIFIPGTSLYKESRGSMFLAQGRRHVTELLVPTRSGFI